VRRPATLAGWSPGWAFAPVNWVWDRVTDFGGQIAETAFSSIVSGVAAWVLDGVAWVAASVAGFFVESTSPDVEAGWFSGPESPYLLMATIGGSVLVLMMFFSVVQGVVTGETGTLARRLAVDVPTAVVGIAAGVVVFQLLIDLSDAMSQALMSYFGDDVRHFADVVGAASGVTGEVATAIVVVLLGLVALLGGLLIFVELVIRSALIYLLVAMAPLAFAALAWPATRGVLRRTVELLVAVIFSKVIIALALSIGGAALAGAVGPGGSTGPDIEVPAEPGQEEPGEPAQSEGDDASSVTAAVGVLLAATAIFGLACFSPFVVLRLLPIVEGAAVAQGVRGGPLRAAQQVQSLRYQHVIARRMAGPAAPLPASNAGGGSSGAASPSPRRSSGSPAVLGSQRSSHPASSAGSKPASEHDGGT
jgi:hypothetical protein